jgi:hypothetical protein
LIITVCDDVDVEAAENVASGNLLFCSDKAAGETARARETRL